MTTIARILADAQLTFTTSETPRLDLEILLADVLGCDRAYLYAWSDKALTAAEQSSFSKNVARRISGEPIAYITGKKEFWSLMLEVNSSTLIPRPETELLVEITLQKFSDETMSGKSIEAVDLGTGTGAIALALAAEKPTWKILACDSQPEAVKLAQRNARALAVTNVTCLVSNWFSCIENKMFDLVVSNPPYIDSFDSHLLRGDVRFEPRTALVADKSGFADIETIIQQSVSYLKSGGWLMLEHGFTQAADVRALFNKSAYGAIETFTDLAGNDRVTIGQKVFGEFAHG